MVAIGILHAFHDVRLYLLNDFALLLFGETLNGLRMKGEINK